MQPTNFHDQLKFAWLAGFVDADGCINAQIISREDYLLKYQVRVSLTVFQSTTRHFILLDIQKILGCGTVRKRNDGMSEFCVVGGTSLQTTLEKLLPYLQLKRAQAKLVLQIIKKLPNTKDPSVLMEAALLADKVGLLTDGKKRTILAENVRECLKKLGHVV